MIELIMILSMSSAMQRTAAFDDTPVINPPIAIMTAAVKPCVWPNRCGGGNSLVG